MKKHFLTLIAYALVSFQLAAQIGKVGINTTTPQAMLHVMDSSVVFTGPASLPGTPGNTPISGTGTRMMWYPDKAAFRAGGLIGINSVNWDKDSIGNYSFAVGFNSKAKGIYSVAMGITTKATGFSSTAIGTGTIASGDESTALGSGSMAIGTNSTALGSGSMALGNTSTAMGNNTEASGDYSTAMGNGSEASGHFSTALSDRTIASGDYSTAMGNQTMASGSSSTSMGFFTTASGNSSTAMGSTTTASGNQSTAMGVSTTASASASTSMGFSTKASGSYSTAMGFSNTARSYASVVIGRYNDSISSSSRTTWEDTDPVFIIGNGADINNQNNALVIYKNGNTLLDGKLARPSTGTANNLLPICYGSISNTGVINSGTSNFSVTHSSTGQFDIDIVDESYNNTNYVTNVTVSNFSSVRMATASAASGKLLVKIWDGTGNAVNAGFFFIVYKP